MGRCFFKHIHPIPQNTPILTCACDGGFAFYHHKDHFAITGVFGYSFTRAQALLTKPNITPPCRLRRDIMYLAMGPKGLS